MKLTTAFLAILIATSAHAQQFEKCVPGQKRSATETCVVDGDTIWLDGENIRLKDFDTPEPTTNICGGRAEIELAHRASARLLDLLNSNDWQIQYFGMDRFGRRLATIRIDGVDVGDVLIREGLAREWPDGPEFWCKKEQ